MCDENVENDRSNFENDTMRSEKIKNNKNEKLDREKDG